MMKRKENGKKMKFVSLFLTFSSPPKVGATSTSAISTPEIFLLTCSLTR